MEQETFWSLLHNAAHWEFEIFLMFVFDVVIGLAIWPFLKKHWNHHVLSDEIHGFADNKPVIINLTDEEAMSIHDALSYGVYMSGPSGVNTQSMEEILKMYIDALDKNK